MCAITETNSCTAAKTIRSFDDGGGQECSCRAATSVAVMMAWNIAHAKVIRPYTSKSCRSRVWHSYKSPEGHTTLRSIWLLDIKQSPSTTRVSLGYIVCCCKSLKKVAEPLSVPQMVSPLPWLNYTDAGCCENSHTIHLPLEDNCTTI